MAQFWNKLSKVKKIWCVCLVCAVVCSLFNGFGAGDDQNSLIALVGLYALHTSSEPVLLLYTALCFITLIIDVIRMVVIAFTMPPAYIASWIVFLIIGWLLKVAGIIFAFICKKDFYEGSSTTEERAPIIGSAPAPPALDPSFAESSSPSFTTGV